ncbi:MAG: sulfotransferase domain-containing protein [Planctomycetota bacterium]|nr:sulfotransferase domain-containing protein [Planctomycetota bacterium]
MASHRRSGTHWVIDTIRRNFPRVRPRFVTIEDLADSGGLAALERLRQDLRTARGVTLLKTHLPAGLEPFADRPEIRESIRALVEGSRRIYVHRDGRDVLVSLYHYLQEFSVEAQGIDFSTFLREENDYLPCGANGANRVEYWRAHVEGWLARPGIHRIAYESMHSDHEAVVNRIVEGLDIGPAAARLKRVTLPSRSLWARARRRLGRRLFPRQTSSAVRPRTGHVGDWKTHFSEVDRALFDSQAGDLLTRLAST